MDMWPNSAKMHKHAATAVRLMLMLLAAPFLSGALTVGVPIQRTITSVPPIWRCSVDSEPGVIPLSSNRNINMKLLQFNCQSYNTTKQQLHRYVRDKDIKILCLSETWNKEETFTFTKHWNTHCKNRPLDSSGNAYGGVAVATHPSIRMVPYKELENDTEIAWTKVYINSKIVHLASVYIPPGKVEHIDKLSQVLDSVPDDAPVILTGDFNATSALWDRRPNLPHNTKSYRVGLKVEELIAAHGLSIHNTGSYTYVKGNQRTGQVIRTAIDLTLTRNVSGSIQWTTDELAPLKSDHLACITNIAPPTHPAPIIRWDLNHIDWTQWEMSLEEALQAWYDHCIDSQVNVNDMCTAFTEAVNKCANDHLPTKSVCSHSRPFFNKELKQAQNELRQARRDFRYRSDQRNLSKLNDAKHRYNEKYTKASTKWWSDTLEKVDRRNIWKIVNKIKNSHIHVVVQPIRTTNNEYLFHDEDIAKKLEETHVHRTNAASLDFDNSWKAHVDNQVSLIIQQELNRVSEPEYIPEYYNVDIKLSEVNKAMRTCNATASPGPDRILPVMLTKAEGSTSKHLQYLFNTCWKRGTVPTDWKRDNRVYIPKPGKLDYNVTKAYRPLSLNSTVGKLYEDTACARFMWFLHSTYQLDKYNFAYQKCSSTAHALLYLVNAVHKGFEENKATAAVCIDLEGAFDGIWRRGLIYQVSQAGIRGNLLLYVADFLTDRKSRSLVGSCITDWSDTDVGVPQGSVIAPILFVFYIRHITSTMPSNVKYADDVTAWVTHIDPWEAARVLTEQLKGLTQWLKKWRLKVSEQKTEVILFCKQGHVDITVEMNNKTLNQVTAKKVIGVDLDENLKFKTHVENISARATKALGAMSSLLSDTGGLNMSLAVMLYKAYILPIITYAYPVWCTVNTSAIEKLERVQRISLLKATGCLNSTATAGLDVLSCCLPLRLTLSEILAAEYTRIMRKSDDQPIKDSMLCALELHSPYSAPKLMKHAYAPTSKTIDIVRVELEPKLSEGYWYPASLTHRTITHEDLGSSKTRTLEMANRARALYGQHLETLPRTTLPIFTDGSSLENPGPCGSAAIVYTHGLDSEPVVLNRPVSLKSSAFHGELDAIALALDYSTQFCNGNKDKFNTIAIYTDCRSALQTVVNGVKTNYLSLVGSIQTSITTLEELGISTYIAWVPGHAELKPNELADRAAKEAAKQASTWNMDQDLSTKSLSQTKREIRCNILKVWQRRWDRIDEARHTHNILPRVSLNRPIPRLSRKTEIKFNRLRSGHSMLEEHSYKMKIPSCPTPSCSCGGDTGSVEHYLLHCPMFLEHRDRLVAAIELKYQSENIPFHLRTFGIQTLLGDNLNLPAQVRSHITITLAKYLQDTAKII